MGRAAGRERRISAPVNLSDVAAAAGVSIATASRALAGKPRVSRETFLRVHTVAAELGYRVDPIARALREGSSRLIGMVVPVIGNPFFAQLVDAVEEEVNRAGFELLLADSHGFIEEEIRRLRVLGERKVDGLVVIPADRDASADALRYLPDGTPVVQVDRATDTAVADFVGVDNERGIQLVLEHLKERGAESVVFAGSDDATSSGVERWEAFHRLAGRGGFDVGDGYRSEFSIASGVAAANRFMKAGLPDAVVAASDLIAIGLLSRFRESGVRVPDDVLVTGFDGSEFATVVWPTLTTVVQPVTTIGADAAALLLSRIGGESGPYRRSRVSPSLQLGESTRTHVSRAGSS